MCGIRLEGKACKRKIVKRFFRPDYGLGLQASAKGALSAIVRKAFPSKGWILPQWRQYIFPPRWMLLLNASRPDVRMPVSRTFPVSGQFTIILYIGLNYSRHPFHLSPSLQTAIAQVNTIGIKDRPTPAPSWS